MTYGLPDSIIVGLIRRATRGTGRMSPFTGRRGARDFGFSYVFRKVILYPAALDFYLNNPHGEVGKFLREKGKKIVVAARRQVGVRTGLLRASIRMNHLRDGRSQYLWIGSSVRHALLHHEGTRPHVIVPREAPILRFMSGSRIIYTRHVNHPGTRPNKYLSDQLYLVKI
jgi:hypothetical protein